MIIHFQTNSGENVAINPNHVILVTEVKSRKTTKITLVDGGTSEVIGDMLEVLARLNANLS